MTPWILEPIFLNMRYLHNFYGVVFYGFRLFRDTVSIIISILPSEGHTGDALGP